MNPSSLDIQEVLVANEKLSLTLGENLFLATLPPRPYNAIVLLDSMSGSTQDSRVNIDSDKLEIKIRNKSYMEGYSKAREIKESLQSKPPVTINDTKYIGFWLTSNLFPEYFDSNKCYIFTLSFNIKRETTTGYRS